MLFGKSSVSTGLLAMVTLSLTVAAALDPIEQHLLARDGDVFSQSKAASGKHATPVNLSNVQASKQAVLKLVGDDLHTPTQSETLLEDSKIAVPGDVAAQLGDRAHCSLGHDSANIKRIRYEMTVQIDRDESGSSTEASSESVRGTVVKATSGLYSDANPDKGACAKSLARHGETCVNRPYIVPQSALPDPSESKASGAAGGKLGKRALGDAASDGKYQTSLTTSVGAASVSSPQGSMCVDTVKREKEVTKVVPTDAHKAAQDPGSKLYFELVRNDEKQGVWNQVIYDKHGKPVDITHLQLSTNMSFWRAEYYCAECPRGTQRHTVLYENIEIEVDKFDEHATPAVQCQGQGKSTNVHKKDKSRYAHKNNSGVDYKGVIFSIDRVTLGKFDAKGKGGLVAVTENQVGRFSGSVPDDAKKSPPPNRYSSQLNDASAAPGGPGGPISKRDSEEERPAPALKGFAKRDFGDFIFKDDPMLQF